MKLSRPYHTSSGESKKAGAGSRRRGGRRGGGGGRGKGEIGVWGRWGG